MSERPTNLKFLHITTTTTAMVYRVLGYMIAVLESEGVLILILRLLHESRDEGHAIEFVGNTSHIFIIEKVNNVDYLATEGSDNASDNASTYERRYPFVKKLITKKKKTLLRGKAPDLELMR
uniref:Uncharacterized protein n=1 Tax=Glossina pallidipes TaxID=7398 RepID=A0A1B0ABZ0_GLOPL